MSDCTKPDQVFFVVYDPRGLYLAAERTFDRGTANVLMAERFTKKSEARRAAQYRPNRIFGFSEVREVRAWVTVRTVETVV